MVIRLDDIKKASLVADIQELLKELENINLNENENSQGARPEANFSEVGLLQAYLDGITTAAWRLGAERCPIDMLENLSNTWGEVFVKGGRYDRFIREGITISTDN